MKCIVCGLELKYNNDRYHESENPNKLQVNIQLTLQRKEGPILISPKTTNTFYLCGTCANNCRHNMYPQNNNNTTLLGINILAEDLINLNKLANAKRAYFNAGFTELTQNRSNIKKSGIEYKASTITLKELDSE